MSNLHQAKTHEARDIAPVGVAGAVENGSSGLQEEEEVVGSPFTTYRIVLQVRDKVLGGIPTGFEREENYMVREEFKRLAALRKEEKDAAAVGAGETTAAATDEAGQVGGAPKIAKKKKGSSSIALMTPALEPYSTFYRDAQGKICLEEKNIKGLFKECAMTLYGRGRASTITQKLIVRALFVKPPVIPLADAADGRVTLERDDRDVYVLQRPVHAMTQQGPRTSIQTVDFVKRPLIAFNLLVAASEITRGVLGRLLELGEEIGIGAVRTQGFGKFDVVSIDKVETPPRRLAEG